MDAPVSDELKNCPDPWNPSVRSPSCPIMQDASYYNGHYYLYYGPAPLVTLMLPFRLVTGSEMPLPLAILGFACAGLLASLVLWELIRERYFPSVGAWVAGGAALILGVANPLPLLIRRTLVYEAPITSAYCFVMFALLALFLSTHSARLRSAWLVAPAACAWDSRWPRGPHSCSRRRSCCCRRSFGGAKGRRGVGISNLPVRGLAAAVLPLAAIGALMAAYNYGRFGRLWRFLARATR